MVQRLEIKSNIPLGLATEKEKKNQLSGRKKNKIDIFNSLTHSHAFSKSNWKRAIKIFANSASCFSAHFPNPSTSDHSSNHARLKANHSHLSLSHAAVATAMASLSDIGVSAAINILTAFAFLLAFALLRIQPINDRVYFPKWYISGGRSSPRSTNGVAKFVNLDFRTYLTFLNWMPQALMMSEKQLIQHAGFDSALFLRIYLLG